MGIYGPPWQSVRARRAATEPRALTSEAAVAATTELTVCRAERRESCASALQTGLVDGQIEIRRTCALHPPLQKTKTKNVW